MPNFINITGQKFNRITVLSQLDEKDKWGKIFWLCQCDCGNQCKASSSSLKSGNTKSCGCFASEKSKEFENLIGQKINRLLIKELHQSIKEKGGRIKRIYKCICDCGKECLVEGRFIKKGHTKSCGCLHIETCKKNNWQGYEGLGQTYFHRTKKGAELRGFEFDITIQEMWELYLKQDKKCALSGIELNFCTKNSKFDGTASLDRIDSSKGYIKGNIQWVHKNINQIKMALPEQELFEYCRLITECQAFKTNPPLT